MTSLRHAGLLALALTLAACQAAPLATGPAAVQAHSRYVLSGTATFEDRQVQIAPTTLTSLATVTLLNASNQTVATARTDAAGAFSLSPVASFTAAAGDLFYLDVYKGTLGNQSGGDVARLRTILQWTATGWNSTSGATVVVNPLTTAVCAIQGLNSGTIAASVTLGTVSGSTVTTGNATINSNWSAVNTLVRDLLSKDQDPLARISLVSGSYRILPDKTQPLVITNFRTGTPSGTDFDSADDLILGGPKPTPNDPTSELDYFQCADVAPDSVAVTVSDGSYLYSKIWSDINSNSPSARKFKKIGTGFNGTVRGAYYGTLDSVTSISLHAAYYKGNIYNPIGGASHSIEVISTTTGALTTLQPPDPLIFRESGTSKAGSGMLLTCDGRYLYNLGYSINNNGYNGYTVQVLDPEQGLSQVRFFTLDTSSYFTDGVWCDGTYLYAIEWRSNNWSRIRRYRLSDGVREAEWTFYQDGFNGTFLPDANNPISGTWDPYNKVFWIGNLSNDKMHMLRGGRYAPTGSWQSAALDTGSAAPLYGRLTWSGDVQGSDGLSFQVRSATTPGGLATATWYGPTSTTDGYTTSGTALNSLHAKQRYLQVRATLTSANLLTTPTLNQLSVEVLP